MGSMDNQFMLQESEKKEIKKRGFYVLKNFTLSEYFKSLLSIPILSGIIVSIIYGIVGIYGELGDFGFLNFNPYNIFMNTPYIGICLIVILSLYVSYYYAISSNIFFVDGNIFGYGIFGNKIEIENKNKKISLFSRILKVIGKFLGTLADIKFAGKNWGLAFVSVIVLIGFIGLYQIGALTENLIQVKDSYAQLLGPYIFNFEAFGGYIFARILWAFSYVFGIAIIGILSKYLVNKFYSIFAFSNLGSRIQSLTPTIEEKSREIEANFREDMDFGKLRSGFSDLSASLAKVSKYILKLEVAEKKANKGNLFDSVKYINSLKGDIVKPLMALRSFLSTRLSELEQSRGEIQKVRVKVGGGEESLALQSARTEPLMVELRGNVEKLDGMIEKL